MIRLEGLRRSFGANQAVDDVTFSIPRAAITILAGADGAGKSTLFRILVGLEPMDEGRILLEGEPVIPGSPKLRHRIGYMPERFSLYPDLSVEENLNFFADIHQVPRLRRESLKERLLTDTGMEPFRKRRAGALSGGMKQKLALSSILLSSPDLVILDEPTTGVDPLSRLEFFSIIEELKREGKTIVMATPYLDEAERGDMVVMLKEGRVLREASIGDLKRDFPARLIHLKPGGNVISEFQKLQKIKTLQGRLFLKGNRISLLHEKGGSLPPEVEKMEREAAVPSLEDIFIYYDRLGDTHGTDH